MPPATPSPPPDTVDFLAEAQALAHQIWEHRVRASDGSTTWLRPGSPASGEPDGMLVRAGPYLFDGAAGIALFLAALARTTGSGEHRDRALATVAPVRAKFAELTDDLPRAARLTRIPIGGMVGIGSLVYAYSKIGEWLNEPRLTSEAAALLQLVTTERIEGDQSGDVLYGCAGTILAMLALPDAASAKSRDSPPYQVARLCAERLLHLRVDVPAAGARAWCALRGFPALGGFSHGAAGICFALLRLYAATGDRRLLQGAEEGLAFENALYCTARANWRDARSASEERFATGWCTGAAGIALSRVASLDVLDTPRIRQDIQAGLAAALTSEPASPDHLCCGTTGRVEALHRAAQILGDPPLETAARALLLPRFATGRPAWRFASSSGHFDPTFFTGAAEIGYTLLRLAAPALPSVLLLA
jgi:lantibiotic modifying enzyme